MAGEVVTSIANRSVLSSRKRGTVKRRTQRARHSDASESFYAKSLTEIGTGSVWSNIAKAAGSPDSSEASNAVPHLGSTKKLIEASALPFVVPVSATLTGFTARLMARSPDANMGIRAQIYTGADSPAGVLKAGVVGSTSKETVIGGRTDLWSTGWTAADMRNNGIKLAVFGNNGPGAGDLFLDSMKLTAHYK